MIEQTKQSKQITNPGTNIHQIYVQNTKYKINNVIRKQTNNLCKHSKTFLHYIMFYPLSVEFDGEFEIMVQRLFHVGGGRTNWTCDFLGSELL